MYKRPNPRPRRNVPTQFVSSALPGGGVVSRWTTGMSKPRIPSGHPSVTGQIIDKLRQGVCPQGPKGKEWTPPINPEFLARHLDNPEAFLARCEKWHEEHPPRVISKPVAPVLDTAPFIALFTKYPDTRPPCEEMCKAMLAAGHTELRITKYRQWCQKMEETADARQEALDLIFAKFPSANKPTPKAKAKKVIKVVKKKMPVSSNE